MTIVEPIHDCEDLGIDLEVVWIKFLSFWGLAGYILPTDRLHFASGAKSDSKTAAADVQEI